MTNLIENPLRFCVTGETEEVVDLLIGEFIPQHCMGKNDMAVTNGLLACAAILVATHCHRTGHDFDEIAGTSEHLYQMSLRIAANRIPK